MTDAVSKADPNVRIPSAVQALAAAAAARQEAYIKELNGEQSEPTPETEEPAPPEAEAPHVEATPDPVPPPARQDRPEPASEEESYRQKFLSSQGRLEKAQAKIGELSEQIAILNRSIHAIQANAAEPAQAPVSYKKLITEKEEEEFGTEFLDVVKRQALEAFEPIKSEYEAKIANLERQVQGVGGYVAQATREQLYDVMNRDVPDWETINYQPEFLSWLALPDPYSGAIRKDMLKKAFENNEASRVRSFFTGFLADEAATTPTGKQPGLTPSPAPSGNGKIPLEKLAAPGRAKTAATTGVPTEKPVFTRAEVAQFYLEVAKGQWRGREEERVRKDRQILEAGPEGRIR